MAFKSEKEAAYWALANLEQNLPAEPANGIEWGMIIYRSPDPEGGYFYDFQWPPYSIGQQNEWEPKGKVPNGAEEVGYCHTHPNDAPFSRTDKQTAIGQRGLDRARKIMYMVTQSWAFWYDERDENISAKARLGIFWGTYPEGRE